MGRAGVGALGKLSPRSDHAARHVFVELAPSIRKRDMAAIVTRVTFRNGALSFRPSAPVK